MLGLPVTSSPDVAASPDRTPPDIAAAISRRDSSSRVGMPMGRRHSSPTARMAVTVRMVYDAKGESSTPGTPTSAAPASPR